MLAIVCPGQGAQTPGLLSAWLADPGCASTLDALSESAEVDLVVHGTVSDADTIRDTAIAQPLIVAAGILALKTLFPPDDLPEGELALVDPARVQALAGHSVGEITAAAAAGVFPAEAAMRFVAARGRAMAAASAVRPTGMSAVVGGNAEEVADRLADLGLTAANINGSGQVVAAGTLEQLDSLDAKAPTRSRVVRLSVAGAFHTEHMQPAVSTLADVAGALSVSDPVTPLLSNADGEVVGTGAMVLQRLVRQVSSPVRWDLCSDALVAMGVTGLLELPPAGTLIGLAKRGMKGVQTLALKTPDDLDAARAFIAAHGHAGVPTSTGGAP